MLPIFFLFFMSLSAGVALLQPSPLSATDQLVKPEERPLEPTDELVKPEESSLEASDQLVKPEERPLKAAQEAAATPPSGSLEEQKNKEQVGAQPAGRSGFGYTMTNGTGNLIKFLNVGFIGGGIFGLILYNTIPKGYFLPEVNNLEDAISVIFLVYFCIAFFAKLGFYFVKGYAWVKAHPTAFMVGFQLLLITIAAGLELWTLKSNFFELKTALTAIWLPIIYFSMALFDLGLGALWQRSWLSSCLLG